MPTTANHGIYFADGNTPDELDSVTAAMASSIDTAISEESDLLRTELNRTGTVFPDGPHTVGDRFWNTATGIGYRWGGTEWLAVEGRLPYANAYVDLAAFPAVTGTVATVPFTQGKVESHPGSINSIGRFTAPVTGIYRMESWVAFFGGSSTSAVVTMRARYSPGGTIDEVSRVRADTGLYGAVNVTLGKDQWFEFRLQRSPAGSTSLAATATATRMQASFLRPV